MTKLKKIIPFILWVFIAVSIWNFLFNVIFFEFFTDLIRKSDFWLGIFEYTINTWLILNILVAIIILYLNKTILKSNKKISFVNIAWLFQILIGLGSLFDLILLNSKSTDCGILEYFVCIPLGLIPIVGIIFAPVFVWAAWIILKKYQNSLFA